MLELSESQVRTVNSKVDRWINKLMDFSGRNRLLFYKPTKTTTLEIVQPEHQDLFTRLVVKGLSITFPQPDNQPMLPSIQEEGNKSMPINAAVTFSSPDTPLVVRCPPKQLSRILYNLSLRAKTAREEQGINILYLAFGFITWRDSQKGELCRSPIILVPVELSRRAINEPYQLTMLEDDLVLNPTLQEALKQYYAIQLPSIDNDLDTPGFLNLLDEVKNIIAGQPDWHIDIEVALDVFSYQKQMIVVDLKEHDSQLKNNPLVLSISIPGFSLPSIGSDPITADQLDDKITPEMTFQILDADSSQQEAIQAAKSGCNFILQGPPGTGKSQTISNIIAEFLADGKKVLFVSAKMAALEVVQDRLKKANLGDFCLQVHSHRRNKREVIDELRQSLETTPVATPGSVQAKIQSLQKVRSRLNEYVRALHRPQFTQKLSAFSLYGKLDELHDMPEMQFFIPATQVDIEELYEYCDCIQQMVIYTDVIRDYSNHPWYGCIIDESLLQKQSEIRTLLRNLSDSITELLDLTQKVCQIYNLSSLPESLNDTIKFLNFANCYLPSVMNIEADTILERFEKDYTSLTRFARPQFWRDRSLIKSQTRDGRFPEIQRLLPDLTQIQNLQLCMRTDNPQELNVDDGHQLLQVSQPLIEQIRVKVGQLSSFFHPSERPENLKNLESQSLPVIQSISNELLNHIGELNDWLMFQNHYRTATRMGIAPFVKEAIARKLPSELWERSFLRRFYILYLDEVMNCEPLLAQFRGEAHQQLVDNFCALDHELIEHARTRIREKILTGRPQASWMHAQSSEEAILRREINKRRRIKPLRVLFAEIPGLILRLRPCLMMSPLTVSQLLDPDKYLFDLVIFDEASQIQPEEAVGAIFRGRQVIVVGDRHQLPPTSFFETLEAEDGSTEENFEEDLESVLNECDAAGMPNKMLAWHYRSRDESLIAFSNHHFYDDKLITFPSAHPNQNDSGISFVFVSDGYYQRSGRRNLIEADKVVSMILDHYQTTPDRSLGVVTFSQAQRDTIQIKLDQALRNRPDLIPHFSESENEPFFVKNLEHVQGDERDVMIFSVGYAKDELGKFILNFGPLNKDGGERRLNVAVTRARYAVKLVASFQPEDIDNTRTKSKGVHLLRSYMTLARDGIKALYTDLKVTEDADFDSPFEQQVYEALRSKGLDLKKQVGVSGYRIDLAIVDTHQPGHFLLGIECDGATYHSSFTARDRDRLRQEVLESLGWRIHRIWSRDWFENPSREVVKVISVLKEIENRQDSSNSEKKRAILVSEHAHPLDDEIGEVKIHKISDLPEGVVYYQPTNFTRYFSGAQDLHNASLTRIANLVKSIVDSEGPIHIDLVKERVAQASSIKRIGNRVVSSIMRGIGQGINANLFIQRGEFLWPRTKKVPLIRVPKNGDERRTIDQICPEEIALAVDLCLRSALSLTSDDLIRETARLFKLNASENNSNVIHHIIGRMEQKLMVEFREDRYYPSSEYDQPIPVFKIENWLDY